MKFRTKQRSYRYRTVRTVEQLQAVVDAYSKFDEFVFDVETRGEHRGVAPLAEVAWIGLAGPDRVDLIPCGHVNGRQLRPARQRREFTGELTEKGNKRYSMVEVPAEYDEPPKQLWPSEVFETLRPLFFSDRRKIAQGARFDLLASEKYFGEKIPAPYGDTIVAHHVLNENRKRYGLEYLVKDMLGMEYSDGKLGKIGIDKFPFEVVARYLAQDCRYEWLLWKMAKEQMAAADHKDRDDYQRECLRSVFEFEMEVLAPMCTMFRYGLPVDLKRRDRVREILEADGKKLKEELHRAAGRPWNLNATADKIWFVYEFRGHKPKFFTAKKQEPSTEATVIEGIAAKDPIVRKLAEYAQVQKYLGTYVNGMEEHLIDGRIRPNFQQVGTATGRMSCSEPNLQNLPRERADEKRFSIRSMFVAPEGYKMIVADYDQIELRLIAHFSKDPTMLATFAAGEDIHMATAALVLGKDPSDISGEERTQYGKVINFAIAYGAGPAEVGRQARIPVDRARMMLGRHRLQFMPVYLWKEQELVNARALDPPGVRTLSGRRRRIPELLKYRDEKALWHAQRQAINTIVQGSAADVMKSGLVRLDGKLEGTGCELIATVHDEVVVLAPLDKVDWAEKWTRIALEGAWEELKVPLTAAVTVCSNWADGK